MLSRAPDFICIGAQKAGTTWLFNQLRIHPGICIPAKESRILYEHEDEAIPSVFEAFYAGCAAGKILGDINPVYAVAPDGPRRAAKFAPAAQYLFLLRDPVARAFSQYKMATLAGRIDPAISFREAFDRDLRFMRSRGMYAGQLNAYEAALRRPGGVALLPFEWIAARPKELLALVFEAIGVEPSFDSSTLERRYAATLADRTLPAADEDHVRTFYAPHNAAIRPRLWWNPAWAA